MKFEKTRVMNFEGAFRGLRNPLESWSRSDSYFGLIDLNNDFDQIDNVIIAWIDNELSHTELEEGQVPIEPGSKKWDQLDENYFHWLWNQGQLYTTKGYSDIADVAFLGPKDLDLAQRMIRAGSSDRKFLRQIIVSVDITAPMYWWSEFDTYKVGTVANSTSKMHKLASTPITLDCFELDDYNHALVVYDMKPYREDNIIDDLWENIINDCETLRQRYNETKDKRYWKELIRLLPESWLQTRTITMNYEILRNIYSQRKHHRLTEWHQFCDWVKSLPYGGELITLDLD